MLDQSFRDRASQKDQGLKLVTVILQNWKKCDLWWAKDSAPESKMAVLTLLSKILQVFWETLKLQLYLLFLFLKIDGDFIKIF